MVIAVGVAKQVRYKLQATLGVAPGTSGGQSLRRVESTLDLAKQTYQSAEINSHYQIQDFRHGVRTVEGAIRGELSPGTYKDFFGAVVRRDFATVTALTGLSITIATGSVLNGVQTYTVTRGSGDWLAGGIKVGQIGRLTAGTFNAANINKNLYVIGLTATVATIIPLNGAALVAEGPIASATWTVPGKTTFIPTTGHTDPFYAIEHYYSDLDETELFLDCKVSRASLQLPATGIATVAFDFMGRDVTTLSAASAPYFTSPAAETTTGVLAAVNGFLISNGSPIAVVTGMNVTLDGNMTAEAVVGSNTYPDIFEGSVTGTGQLTAFFESVALRDFFINETEVSLLCAMSTGTSATADFFTISMPRIKYGGAAKDDGQKGLVQTMPFQLLRNSAGGTGTNSEQSTIAFQDSQA